MRRIVMLWEDACVYGVLCTVEAGIGADEWKKTVESDDSIPLQQNWVLSWKVVFWFSMEIL